MEAVRVSLPVHRITCVIPVPETNVENVDQQNISSDKYVSWVSASSFKKIQGDMVGKVNILRGDSIGHCEKRKFV
jgi:hypothetical protein